MRLSVAEHILKQAASGVRDLNRLKSSATAAVIFSAGPLFNLIFAASFGFLVSMLCTTPGYRRLQARSGVGRQRPQGPARHEGLFRRPKFIIFPPSTWWPGER
jgi:hypothetical protein